MFLPLNHHHQFLKDEKRVIRQRALQQTMVTDMEMVLKGRFSSIEVPVDGETTSITALVSQPAIHPKEFMD